MPEMKGFAMFSAKEKIKAFDMIAERYYKRNFGTMLKNDVDTLLFHIYIEHCLDHKMSFDDYTLSKELGVTQARIRSLKQSKELKYPRKNFCWKKDFVDRIQYAHIDPIKKLVKLTIPDVNVLIELRHFLEERGWYDEYQLNPKLFQCRIQTFVTICNLLDDNDELTLSNEAKEKLKRLSIEAKDEKGRSAIKRILDGSIDSGLAELVLDKSVDLLEAVFPPLKIGHFACKALVCLAKAIKDSKD